jgi:hypothetical protein
MVFRYILVQLCNIRWMLFIPQILSYNSHRRNRLWTRALVRLNLMALLYIELRLHALLVLVLKRARFVAIALLTLKVRLTKKFKLQDISNYSASAKTEEWFTDQETIEEGWNQHVFWTFVMEGQWKQSLATNTPILWPMCILMGHPAGDQATRHLLKWRLRGAVETVGYALPRVVSYIWFCRWLYLFSCLAFFDFWIKIII